MLQRESRFVHKTIADLCNDVGRDEVEIIALMRREHMLLPHPETLLEPRDRLILIASPTARKSLEKDVTEMGDLEQVAPLEP